MSRLATRAIPRTQIPVWVVTVFCVGLAGGLLLPLGPDVSGGQIEGSLRAALNDEESPPSNEGDGIKSLDCSRKLFVSNSKWTCKLEREIALFPDASSIYDISVDDDGCWAAAADMELSDNETHLVGTRFDRCIQPE